MAKRFLTYDTQNPPSNVNEQGVMVGSGKPVFFISCCGDRDGSMYYYYDQDRKATLQEIVDTYFAGNGYLYSDGSIDRPYKIVGIYKEDNNDCARILTYGGGASVPGVTNADFDAAMAKYYP